jgi:nucleotide-binding universal stress UspA family protein
MDRIVVGIDGSDGSRRALEWALEDARRRGGAKVEVVHAWEPPVLSGIDATGVTVEQVVIEGPPGASLCELGVDAALIVVGSSGHGAVMDALIGSVSQYCSHHAPCPLVIIPSGKKKHQH